MRSFGSFLVVLHIWRWWWWWSPSSYREEGPCF